MFLHLLPRLATASNPLSQWRTRALFATHARTDDTATVTSDILELELISGALHVRCSVGSAYFFDAGKALITLRLLSHQLKGWGDASMSLCARVVAEVQSLCRSSFRGVELEAPKAMCCTRGCDSTLGTLHDLATAALRGVDSHAVTTCAQGHATRLQPFVGMLPGAEDAHAAELLYWLRILQDHLRLESSAVVGIDDGSSDNGDHDDAACLSMHTSLAMALVRWAAHTFHEAGTPSSHCPRVWVPVLHDSNSPTLVLRPVCEHAMCLHAVLPHSRRAMNDVASLVVTHDGHRHADMNSSLSPDCSTTHTGRAQWARVGCTHTSGSIRRRRRADNTRDHRLGCCGCSGDSTPPRRTCIDTTPVWPTQDLAQAIALGAGGGTQTRCTVTHVAVYTPCQGHRVGTIPRTPASACRSCVTVGGVELA